VVLHEWKKREVLEERKDWFRVQDAAGHKKGAYRVSTRVCKPRPQEDI